MPVATSPAFKQNAHRAITDAGLQKALARSGPSFIARRAAARDHGRAAPSRAPAPAPICRDRGAYGASGDVA